MRTLRKTVARRRKYAAGVTLVELAIATSLLVAFGGAAILATDTAGKSVRTEVVSSKLESAARRTLGTITRNLRAADPATVPQRAIPAGEFRTQIDFRRVVGYDDENETINLGDNEQIIFELDPGEANDGVDNDDDGLIDEGRIVHIVTSPVNGERRRVLCSSVSDSLEGEIPGNLIDDNGNGIADEGGFCVSFDGNRAIIRITLAQLNREGYLIDQTYERSVTLRNTETP